MSAPPCTMTSYHLFVKSVFDLVRSKDPFRNYALLKDIGNAPSFEQIRDGRTPGMLYLSYFRVINGDSAKI